MKNQIQLITYVDRIGGKTLKELQQLLSTELKGLFGGVHLLPFFYPIDGQDAGFDPIDHTQVDSRLGDWNDIKALSQEVDIMSDVIVNHMSAQSAEFKDFLEKGKDSEYSDLFLSFSTVFPDGASETELANIYRPRPGFSFTNMKIQGENRLIWTTFTSNQIDIDVNSPGGKAYLDGILDQLERSGVNMIRLDAAGYAIKKKGTTCFMIEETFDFIAEFEEKASQKGIDVLVEIHSFFQTQIEIAKKVGYVYDFALPVLVLDLLYNQTAERLKHWIGIRPTNTVTVLDTHDGIGIIDVASENGKPGLIPDAILEEIVETMHAKNKDQSRKSTGAAASNLDLYQVNCTYFEALGQNKAHYLLARAIQFFLPGVPQVYYVGLFGDVNDMDLLAQTGVGRDINRHYYSREEIQSKLQQDFILQLQELMRLRNTHPSFQGTFALLDSSKESLHCRWEQEEEWSELEVDPQSGTGVVRFSTTNGQEEIQIQ